MAALLRQGARRIGGSVLQRTQAALTSPAAAEERRRLVPRRLYRTDEEPHGGIVREIQQRIDELYDLISKGEKNCWTDSWRDAFLLVPLSRQVTPRPSDSKWRDLHSATGIVNDIKTIGVASLIFFAMEYYDGYSNDTKVAPVMVMEEEHEARAVETGSRLM